MIKVIGDHMPRRCNRCGEQIKPGEIFIARRIDYNDGESRMYYNHLACRRTIRLANGTIVQLTGVVS